MCLRSTFRLFTCHGGVGHGFSDAPRRCFFFRERWGVKTEREGGGDGDGRSNLDVVSYRI